MSLLLLDSYRRQIVTGERGFHGLQDATSANLIATDLLLRSNNYINKSDHLGRPPLWYTRQNMTTITT